MAAVYSTEAWSLSLSLRDRLSARNSCPYLWSWWESAESWAQSWVVLSRSIWAGDGVSLLLHPALDGLLTLTQGLWIFLPPTGLIALVFLLLRIPDQVGLEKSSTVSTVCGLHHKLDFVGFLIFTPACVMFLLAVSWGGSKYAWGSAATIGLLCGSGVMAAIFGGWMWHYGDRAMIPPRIVMKPVVLYGCILSMVQGGAFLMLQYYLPLWFQSVKGASPEEGGVMMLPTCVAQIVAGIGCSALRKTTNTFICGCCC